MSFCTFTDNLGNTYQLTSGNRIESLATADYFTALEALGRIDVLQLAAAEDELLSQPRSGWQDMNSVGIFSTQAHHPHIGIGFLPGRWPRILDAIHQGNLRFIQTGSAKKAEDELPHDTRNLLRVKIRQALLAIVAAERAEASQHVRQLRQETSVNRGLIYTGAFLTGLWQAGSGFAQWLKDVNDVVSPLQRSLRGVQAAYRATQRSDNGENLIAAYQDEILTAEKREIVQVLGFDPTAITREQFQHATELADLIWEDPALQADLRRFVKDYVKAQHAIEITEFSGAAAFEVLFTILLAAVTGGAGLAASAASLTRHFAKFRKVGQLLLEFGEQIKKARVLRDRHAPAKRAASFEDFENLGEVEIAKPADVAPDTRKKKPKPREKTDFSQRKGIPPTSLEDAVSRLNSMADEIARNDYHPKYTDAELKALAETGDISKERYQVRFMESRHLTNNGAPGMLGAPMRGVSGNGAKYWSTSFDQLEDADTNARLISEKLGLDYDPTAKYTLIVIDTEKAAPLTGVKSVPATFDKVSEFANRELPEEFPKRFTDTVMTPEFQDQYGWHYQEAVDKKFLKSKWSTKTSDFEDYLDTTDLSETEKELLKQRMEMQETVGNNQYYEGNGLTRDKIAGSGNHYGAVETLNFERQPVNLQQLEKAGAIAYVSKGFK